MKNIFICILIIFIYKISFSQEIIQDNKGNYILIKKDGTYKKLPAPKKGYKYILKKKKVPAKANFNKADERKNKKKGRSAKKMITKSVTPVSD